MQLGGKPAPGPSVPPQPTLGGQPKPFVAHYAFPRARRGDVVRVEIDADANVLLLDDAGVVAYQRHEKFHYVGGAYPHGSVLLNVPHDGSWHVVIDLGGSPGLVRHRAAITHHDPDPLP